MNVTSSHPLRITVFGGTGFIGRYVVDRLCDAGYSVRVATRRPAAAYFLRTAGTVGQVAPVACNIHQDNSILNAIEGSDVVINLVGILAQAGKKNRFDRIHADFPARLAVLARQARVTRIVHVSAIGADVNGPSDYARTKAAGELALTETFPDVVILRPSIVFGREDGFFNMFARMAAVVPFLPLIGGGKTKFQPVFVGDVAAAIAAVVERDDARGKIFELGGPDILSFRQLYEKIFAITHVRRRLVSVPFWAAKIQGAFLQNLPGQLLTVDQVRSLSVDNVVSGDKPGLSELGIAPTPLDSVLPTYLDQYRPGGRFAPHESVA
jgi:uncharacterized protein YbjT (DUF2867 family)